MSNGRISLLGRVYALVTVLFVLLGVLAAGTVVFRKQAATASTTLTTVTLPAQAAAAELTKSYSEQANAARGYVITGDSAFLRAYETERSETARLEEVVEERFGHDPAIMNHLADVRESARNWQHQFFEPQLYTALQSSVAGLSTRVDEIAASERAETEAARTLADWLTALIFLAGFSVAAVGVILLHRSLTHPLRTLVAQIEQVASGDLDRPVDEVGPPELTMLARAVETMRGRMLRATRWKTQMLKDLARYEEAERQRAEQDYATVVAALDEGVVVVGSTGRVEAANSAAERILGASEVVGSALASWRLFDEAGMELQPEQHPSEVTRWTGEPENSRVVRLAQPDGGRVWLAATSRALTPQGQPPHKVVLSFTDITESWLAREQLEYEATHDPLTGLANRTLVLRHLGPLRLPEIPMAMLFLDLDNFKRINDSLGHGVGDEVLRTIGQRLLRTAPDEALVGRLGGDEFVVVVHDHHDELTDMADRLLGALTVPVRVHDRQVHVNASIGVVVSPTGDTRDDQELLRDADVAMYQAKTQGSGRWALFDVELRERVQRHMALEQDLRQAVEKDQFWVAYQPLIELGSERTVAVEALLRWEHPVHGSVSPGEFIPIAEESDLINQVGAHMLRTATWQLAAFRKRCGLDLQLNANLSPRQLEDPDLQAMVEQALAASGLPTRALCFEITENALMQDPDAASRVLHALRALGVRLAIDDFGTGYSSMAQLRRMPLDILKIDRSFVTDLGSSAELEAIVKSIVVMAHAVGLAVVGEGVETARQLALLRRLGCDQVQGFYLGEPAPIDEFVPSTGG
ncbi:hypothetical protein GCM10027563_44780 [Parasphingorhabdus pacifica]